MYMILGRMKAYGGPNKVISRFAAMDRSEWNRSVWESLHGERDFVFSSPLVQLFNPQSAKGYALLKPNGTNRSDRTKDRWAEPFLEWLRYRGYFGGAAAWFTDGDLRLFCPIPGNIPYHHFSGIASEFRNLNLGGTAVKIDCRAALGLTRLLIGHADAYRRPRQSMSGIWVTHYKDMGQAHTVLAAEQLAIPDWFGLRNTQQAEQWLETLDEHDTILRRLIDNHSDELALLKQYRRTLQRRPGESIWEFVEFLRGYGTLVFRRRARDHWILPQLKARGVAAILNGDPDLRSLLQNPGFLAVASAIRSSTVGAQAARYNGKIDHREIRYGLLGDIQRASLLGRKALMEIVSPFIGAFNREGAYRRAVGLASVHIQDCELEAFRTLIEKLPAGVPAGSALCGFSACLPVSSGASEAESQLLHAIPA
jgi:hypothetical protein